MLDNTFEIFVFSDELEGGAGTDAFDRIEVVATEKDTEVDELGSGLACALTPSHIVSTWVHSMASPSSTLSR